MDNDSYEVAEISYNFWYILSELIYKRDDPELNQLFAPYVHRVLMSICKHIQLDKDMVRPY